MLIVIYVLKYMQFILVNLNASIVWKQKSLIDVQRGVCQLYSRDNKANNIQKLIEMREELGKDENVCLLQRIQCVYSFPKSTKEVTEYGPRPGFQYYNLPVPPLRWWLLSDIRGCDEQLYGFEFCESSPVYSVE